MTDLPTTAATTTAPPGLEDRSGAGGSRSLARAVGRQTAGLRAAAVLSGDELAQSLDLLAEAARRRLPLVVHLTAEDHSAYHAAASTGALLLFAADPQEAIDLPLIARRAAERALVPAVVAMDAETARGASELEPLAPETVERYLGAAGELIHPPTPGQAMLFGKHRRRVPRWHDPERPLLVGAGEGAVAAAASASRRVFSGAHLPELLDEAFAAFAEETGRRYGPLRTHGTRRAGVLLVAQGSAVATAEEVADRLRETGGPRVGVVGLRALRPLPEEELLELLRGCRAVAVLERVDPGGPETPLATELRALSARAPAGRGAGIFGRLAEKDAPRLVSAIQGLGGAALRCADLETFCRHLARPAELPSPLYLGLDTAPSSVYPKRRAHLDAVRRAYPQVAGLGLSAETDETRAADPDRGGEAWTPPAALRGLGRSAAPLGDVPRFWDRTGVLFRPGETETPAPDPFLAAATVPPLAAALAAPPARELLPAFDPAPCTGCGDCWSACPDGALGPVVIGAAALLEQGMRLAQRRGRSVDKLRMVKSKLADRVRKAVADDAAAGGVLGDLLDAAFEPLIAQMKLPDDREAAVRDAFGAVRDELAALPVARTDPFFEGAGDLFSLALDPDACKGCGLCVAACEPAALTSAADDPGRTAAARSLWRLAEELPAPGDAALERAGRHPQVGPLAGALLAPEARRVMAAAPRSEPGSGEALAARQVVGLAAARLLPLRRRQAAEVEELRERLAAAIHQELADALPDRDLDALAEGLGALERPEADLAELTGRVETAFESERVDVARTRRLVAAARELADLRWRLETGEGGLGRAPFGLVLAGSPAAWAGTFPDNPFAVPVTAAADDGAALALGLAEGQLEGALEHVRALRRARWELDPPPPGEAAADPERPVWADLDADERRFCPPLLLLASEEALAPGLVDLAAALETDLPLKVLALRDGAGAPLDLGLLALAGSKAVVAQTSVAHPDHLGEAVAAALDHDGPAFVRVLAPGPARGGFAADQTLERARQTVAAGAFPLWRSDPAERTGRPAEDLVKALTTPIEDASPAEAAAPAEDAPEAAPAALTELERRHAAELAALRAEHEARLQGLESSLRLRMAQRVRGRLLELVARGGRILEGGNGREAGSREARE